MEPAARRGERRESDTLADAQDLQTARFGGCQPRQARDLRLQRVEAGEAPVEQDSHVALVEQRRARRIGPQDARTVAAEDQRRARVEQRRADGRDRDQIEIGIGLAVHTIGQCSPVPGAASKLNDMLIQPDFTTVHALAAVRMHHLRARLTRPRATGGGAPRRQSRFSCAMQYFCCNAQKSLYIGGTDRHAMAGLEGTFQQTGATY